MATFDITLRISADIRVAVDAADQKTAEALSRGELARRLRVGAVTLADLAVFPESISEAEIIDALAH